MRPGGGRGGAREQRHARRARTAPRPSAPPPGPPPARPACHAGRARHDERAGGDEDHHRQREVGHHPARREPVEHGQPAHHGLAEHAGRQQRGEQREVAAERPAREREHEGRDRADPDDAREHPVAELDVGVRSQLRREPPVLVAVGPVRAAEAGARDPHGRAGEDDQHERAHRDARDEEVLLRRQGDPADAADEALHHLGGHSGKGRDDHTTSSRPTPSGSRATIFMRPFTTASSRAPGGAPGIITSAAGGSAASRAATSS